MTTKRQRTLAAAKHCAPIDGLVDGSGRPADMCTYANFDMDRRGLGLMLHGYTFPKPVGTQAPQCTGAVSWKVCE